jgi:anti-sigma B factor antagonist
MQFSLESHPMSESSLQIIPQAGTQEGQRILRLQGALVLQTVFQFQTAVREEPLRSLIVDFSGVSFMDSAGLGALVAALVSSKRNGQRLALVGANARVRALIEMSQLSALFPAYGTVAEAEHALG